MMPHVCACLSPDAYECWAWRYGCCISDVVDDGGPCFCSCHDEEDGD